MARVMENCALAMSPLVLAVGSHAGAFCAASGAAAATPIDKAVAILVTIAFIKDLPDL
jgi:hypothetical protein